MNTSTSRKDNNMATENLAVKRIPQPKKKLLLNAFDMFTPSHLAFGQWANPRDRSKDKRRDLTYWTDLAKILEKGSFIGYFLADTFGPYDVYKGGTEPTFRTGAQWPMADPIIVGFLSA